MELTKEQKKLVLKELDTIKAKATIEEISKLDFSTFKAERSSKCIYGQMTGHCESPRAYEIKDKRFGLGLELDEAYNKVSSINRGEHFTILEIALFEMTPEKHAEVIQYLKGEIQTIEI